MADILYTNQGNDGVIITPSGNWGFKSDKRLYDPDGNKLMRDVDVSADQTALQKQIDAINNTLASNATALQSDNDRLNNHDTVLGNQNTAINNRILGTYGLDSSLGDFTGYSAFGRGNHLVFVAKDKNNQDHFHEYYSTVDVDNLLNNKFDKTGGDVTGQTNFIYDGYRASFQVDGNFVVYNPSSTPQFIFRDGNLTTTGWIHAGSSIQAVGTIESKSTNGLNFLDIHADDDGVMRFYAKNAWTTDFYCFTGIKPNDGNIDFTSPTAAAFINGNRIFATNFMGSGSGLDADLLDGLDSSAFVRANAPSTMVTDLFMNGYAIYNQSTYGVSNTRIQFEKNNHITFINGNGDVGVWMDLDGANKALNVNGNVNIANALYSPCFATDTSSSTISYAGRHTSFQNDGNTVWYGTDNAARTTIKDGNLWTNGIIDSNTYIRGKDMFILHSTLGSGLNELDIHMDSDGCWRQYVQNAMTGGTFKQPINYVPTGNFDLYGAGGLFYNGHLLWHNGNQGSGSGLDADLLDGRDSSDFASAADRNNLQNQITNFYNMFNTDNSNVIRLPGNFCIQAFTVAADNGTVVNFPEPFSEKPLIIQIQESTGDWDNWVNLSDYYADHFVVSGSNNHGDNQIIPVLAIGKKY